MTVIGVVLILVAALLLLAVLLGGSDSDVALSLAGVEISMSTMGIFLLGAATVLIFVCGLELLRSGLKRSMRRRRELKRARAVVADNDRRGRRTGDHAHTETHPAADTSAPGTSTGADPDTGGQPR